MNIKQLIKKLEDKTPVGFCSCFHDYWAAAINSVYDNVPFTEGFLPEGGFCEKCQKPVNPTDSKTMAGINEIYG